MDKNFKKGDFIYLPASTIIFQFKDGGEWVEKSRSFGEPLYLPYVGRSDTNREMCLVFFDGCIWCVPEKNTYEGVSCE